MENKVEICQSLDFKFMFFLGLPNSKSQKQNREKR